MNQEKKPKGMKAFPNDPAALKGVKGNIQEVVDALIRKASEDDLIGSIKETALEKYGVDGAWLVAQAKIKYDLDYNEGKSSNTVLTKAEDIETIKEMNF